MPTDPPDVSAWPGVEIGAQLGGGHRSVVWHGSAPAGPVVIRRTLRGVESLTWELDLLVDLTADGFTVPEPIPTQSGELRTGTTSIHKWIDGREPTTETDWRLVANELARLHRSMPDRHQRPGCSVVTDLGPDAISVDADMGRLPADVSNRILSVFAEFGDAPTAVIHGDPGAANIRLTDDGRVGLLDWDESRVDLTYHDLSNLGIRVLEHTLHDRAVILSHAWETANAWVVEPDYARGRLRALEAALS